MGDELVLDVFSKILRDGLRRQAATVLGTNETTVTLDVELGGVLGVDEKGKQTRHARPFAPNYRALNFAVLGGGSLLDPALTRWGQFCATSRAARVVPMYIHATGTQMDSDRIDIRALQCVKKPAFGGLRGPKTLALIRQLGNVWSRYYGGGRDAGKYFNLHLPIISDSGILTSSLFPRHVGKLVHEVDAHTSPAGVICISGLPNGLDAVKLARAWADNYTVVLMPVDHVTYHKLKKKVGEGLDETLDPVIRDRIILNQHYTHYGVWLALLDRCSVMLTSRLHAMILSASTQRPFQLFQESQRSRIKMQDFLANTFDEKLEKFRLPDNWQGSMAEVVALFTEQETNKWKQRYDAGYVEREIAKPYEAHLREMGKFLDHIIPRSKYKGVTKIQVTIQRFFDGAMVKIRLK